MALINIPDRLDKLVGFYLGVASLATALTISPEVPRRYKQIASSVAIGITVLAYDRNHRNKPIAVQEKARVTSELNVVSDYILAQETSQSEEIQYDLVEQIERLFRKPTSQVQSTNPETIEPKSTNVDNN